MKCFTAILAAVTICSAAFAQKKDPNFCRFVADDQFIVVDEIGNLSRVDVQSATATESYKIETDPKSKIVRFMLTPDRKLGVALFRNFNLWIWEISGGKVVASIPKVHEANAYGRYVVFIRDKSVFRYDPASQTEEKLPGDNFIVPQSQMAMAVMDGPNISVYGSDPAPKTMTLPQNTDKIDLSRDGNYVLTATGVSSNKFTWTVLKVDDGSKVFEREETFTEPADKLSRFGFTWQGRVYFLAEKNFATPMDKPVIGLYNIDGTGTGAEAATDSEPTTWTSAGLVFVGSNVAAPDRSWMIPKDPDDKYTPATDANVSPDGTKLIVMRKKTSQMEFYDLKDTEKLTVKAMGIVSMDYNRPKMLKRFPIP